jgi:lipopolysaccharide export system permease protein
VVVDISEKTDDFVKSKLPVGKIITDYYFGFIPRIDAMLFPLFVFIAVIFFTSKMATRSEVVAILSSGVSFRRILYPYFVSAFALTVFAFVLSNYIIPHSNARKLAFEEEYYHSSPKQNRNRDIHKQIEPGIFVYLESYNTNFNRGIKFSIEKFEDGKLASKLFAEDIGWDSVKNKWHIRNYYIREFQNENQLVIQGRDIDTTLNLYPDEFRRRDNAVEAMNLGELNRFINNQKMQGAEDIDLFMIEKHRRFSFPFSAFILTLIGVSVSSKKVKGGIGMQLGIGLLISFSYIVFMQFSSQFAISGAFSPFIAVWIPNVLFTIIAVFLYRLAPK